jgi:hypothetical protein
LIRILRNAFAFASGARAVPFVEHRDALAAVEEGLREARRAGTGRGTAPGADRVVP